MNNQIEKVHQGVITEDEQEVNLIQLCRFCNLTPDHIIELVGEGVLETIGDDKHHWRFSFTTIDRVKKVQRLRSDFELSVTGVGLVLHLLDEIERLEGVVNRLS